eukprot:scaffold1645_cov16-Tisochrysis_lutea.AAC.3
MRVGAGHEPGQAYAPSDAYASAAGVVAGVIVAVLGNQTTAAAAPRADVAWIWRWAWRGGA